ncbi:MAG: hypothetical protein WC191_09275 [Proteiniphilum sp.]
MDYSNFITNIGQWINRRHGEADDIIAQQIVESQYEIEKKFPLWFLIDEYTQVIPAGATSTKLPNHIVRVLDAEILDSNSLSYPLMFGTPAIIRDRYPSFQSTNPIKDRPQVAYAMGHVIRFAPQADAQYVLRFWAHHHLDPLDLTTNTSNVWTTTYLATLRMKVLVDLEAFLKDDERIPVWKTRLNELLDDLEAETRDMENVGMREAMSDTEDVY